LKQFKTLLALVLALMLTLSVASVAFAANDGSIKITPPDGTQADSKNTYTLYKVFAAETDGSAYSYHLSGSHTDVPTGFVKDDAGNVYFAEIVTSAGEGTFDVMVGGEKKTLKNKTALAATDIDAIAAYVTDDDIIDTKVVTGMNPAEFTGLAYGYYYVATTTGTLVVIDSTQPAVEVNDKNEVPPLTKKITDANDVQQDDPSTELDEAGKRAIAQVGTNVEYTLTVTKKPGAENYEVHDTMGTGLKYNKDVAITVGGTAVAAANYTKTETDSSLVVLFNNTYMAGLDDDTVITLVYTALVTEDALHTVPAKNTAWLEYGHNPGDNKTPVQETETYNATFSVTKKDGKDAPLAGAGFVLKDKTTGKYYQYIAATADPATPETIAWVDSIDNATEYTSQAADGKLNGSFTGLPNGTYVLIEKTVPTGYNKAADFEFTVQGQNYTTTNLLQETTVINNQGAELPSTGGIGTTIFYIAGIVMVLGAAAIVIARRKAEQE